MSGLDFLKACKTNVFKVGAVFDARYAFYVPTDEDAEEEDIHDALSELRNGYILCSQVEDGIFVFDITEHEHEELPTEHLQKFVLQHEGSMCSPVDGWDSSTVKSILLAAIEASLSLIFSETFNMVHLGSWTWLFAGNAGSDSSQQTGIFIEVSPTTTETEDLYISYAVKEAPVLPIDISTACAGDRIILAPSGLGGSLAATSSTDAAWVLENPTTFRSRTWMTAVSYALLANGTRVDAQDDWLPVVLDQHDRRCCVWPARLCLTVDSHRHLSPPDDLPVDWHTWFNSSTNSDKAYRDPLRAAEQLFERLAKNEANNTNTVTTNNEISHEPNDYLAATIVAETPMATSPPFSQRLADQHASLSGIYPTPPDGYVPHTIQPIGMSDAPSGVVMHHDETDLPTRSDLPDSDDQPVRGSSLESARDEMSYQAHSDDLFGDMQEIDFATNEVGDADFDYFDEPDDLPAEDDVHDYSTGIATDRQNEAFEDDAMSVLDPMVEMQTVQLSTANTDTKASAESPDRQIYLEGQVADIPAALSFVTTTGDSVAMKSQIGSNDIRSDPGEPPLSPFTIRDRFLPRPVPASAASVAMDLVPRSGRSNTFEPLRFNEDLTNTIDSQWDLSRAAISTDAGLGVDIALPPKGPRPISTASGLDVLDSSTDMSSDAMSEDSATTVSDLEYTRPVLSGETRKRKRSWYRPTLFQPDEAAALSAKNANTTVPHDSRGVITFLVNILTCDPDKRPFSELSVVAPETAHSGRELQNMQSPPSKLRQQDIGNIAQLICEQAASMRATKHDQIGELDLVALPEIDRFACFIGNLLEQAVEHSFGSFERCDPAKIALTREPPSRAMPHNGKAAQVNLPKPPQREGSMQLGPDLFNLPAPYIRVRRGEDVLEMLPPAVPFWSTLGLGPVSGTKDITAIAISPPNRDLLRNVSSFLEELASTYESSKFGSFHSKPTLQDNLDAALVYEEGILAVEDIYDTASADDAVAAYLMVCEHLGEAVASYGCQHPERTIVACVVDPFEQPESSRHMAACCWTLYTHYREAVQKLRPSSAPSDLAFHIIPVSLLASPEDLVIFSNQQMGAIAQELYDRCPPSAVASLAGDGASELSITAAPAVELAVVPPKRINFMLHHDPPSDLMQEGSVLHLAYDMTADGKWMTVCWIDNTGRHNKSWTLCLRGKSFRMVASELWDQTMQILNARAVTWRVFVVSSANVKSDVQQCWRNLVAAKPRKQNLHVTLVSTDIETPTTFIAPPSAAQSYNGTSNFPTPATTPQASGNTASPETTGSATVATPTPAASDTAPGATADTDPDAYLVDISDESWGMLLSPDFNSSIAMSPSDTRDGTCLATGLLLRRGSAGLNAAEQRMEALCVRIHWDIRMRPGVNIEDGPQRQAEATMREVLRFYRGLSLLSRLRGMVSPEGGQVSMLPLHVLSAKRAAKALDGFL